MSYADNSWGLSLSFSSGGPPANATDMLGWWVVPIGVIVGGGLLLLTFRFGTWSIRKFWKPRGSSGTAALATGR